MTMTVSKETTVTVFKWITMTVSKETTMVTLKDTEMTVIISCTKTIVYTMIISIADLEIPSTFSPTHPPPKKNQGSLQKKCHDFCTA